MTRKSKRAWSSPPSSARLSPTVHPPVLHPATIKLYGRWHGTVLAGQSRSAHRCWLRLAILNATSHHHSTALCHPHTLPPHFFLAGFRLFSSVDRSIFCCSTLLMPQPKHWEVSTHHAYHFTNLTWIHDRWMFWFCPFTFLLSVISHVETAVAFFASLTASHTYL